MSTKEARAAARSAIAVVAERHGTFTEKVMIQAFLLISEQLDDVLERLDTLEHLTRHGEDAL